MRLVTITQAGVPAEPIAALPDAAREALAAHAGLYGRVGFAPPWLGYLALVDGACVGACGFTAPPAEGRIEIAYFTFPGNEGRGIATQMARSLIAIVRQAQPDATVIARTLMQESASTAILRKLNFKLAGTISHPEDGDVWEWRLPEVSSLRPEERLQLPEL